MLDNGRDANVCRRLQLRQYLSSPCRVSCTHFASHSMAPTGKLSSMMQVYILTTAPPWTSKIGESTVVLSNRPSSSPLQASSSSEEELSSSSSSLSPVEEPLSSLLLPGKCHVTRFQVPCTSSNK